MMQLKYRSHHRIIKSFIGSIIYAKLLSGDDNMEYSIPAVPPGFVMDTCKFAASATASFTRENLIECFQGKFQKPYITRAIQGALQLRLIEEDEQLQIRCSQRFREDIRKATKEQLNLPFRQALQDYPPFVVYADLLSKGYESSDASAAVHGIFSTKTSPSIIDQSFRSWGVYSGIIEQDEETKMLRLTIDTEKLMADYVKNLLETLASDFKAKIFMVDRLTTEVYAYLTTKNLSIQELVDALRGYESNPSESVNEGSKILESYLHKLAEDSGINVTTCKGITELADALRQPNPPLILKNQRNVCQGLASIRNISSHGVDLETGKPWKVNEDAALASILLTPIIMRSIHNFINKRTQEL